MPRKKKVAPKVLFDVWLRRKMGSFTPEPLTPAQVAKAVSVNEGTVSRWLNEGRIPERKQVAALSVLFRVSPADILKVTDPAEFVETVKKVEARQPDEMDVLAQVPEVRALMEEFAKLSPKRRAALMMLAQDSERLKDTES